MAVPALTTRFQYTVQLLVCDGCCCGKTEQGHPPVPFTALQQRWQSRKFWHLHLTPCYYLGPCDVPNVACVLKAGEATWFGRLETTEHYTAVLDWAANYEAGTSQPLPASLAAKRLER